MIVEYDGTIRRTTWFVHARHNASYIIKCIELTDPNNYSWLVFIEISFKYF